MISKTNQLELRHLRYFLVLASNLHYRKSAEILLISQSALSQQIKQVEVILGFELFTRNNRKVVLSSAGKLFVKEAQTIVQQVNISISRWNATLEGIEGQLKIGFVGSAMQHYLPGIIKLFSENYPKIHFHLEELTNSEQILELEKGTIDIGFIRSNKVSNKVKIKSVHKENLLLVLPMNHGITETNFQNMGQLANESFILFPNENSPMYYQQIQNLCMEYDFSPQISHKSIHGPTIFKLVENGMGISIVPNSLRDDYNYNVRFIELDKIPQKTELFAAWNKTNENAALANFLNLVK